MMADVGQWIRDYGAVTVAGVAVVLTLVNLLVTVRSKRAEWERNERLQRYSTLVASAGDYKKSIVGNFVAPVSPPSIEAVRSAESTFEANIAAVLMLGPRSVARAASALQDVIYEYHRSVVIDHVASAGEYNQAMNEFIDACSAALDITKWRAMERVERQSWPR
jgi:hypothetical protein